MSPWHFEPEYTDDVDDLTDAIIEDTVHCQICRLPLLCGSNDLILDDDGTLCLCAACCERAAKAWEQYRTENDICEHGIICGEWCDTCAEEIKRARKENETA